MMWGRLHLVLDLHIAHDRFGSSSNPCLNGYLQYPTDIDRTINDKFLQYQADYNNRPSHAISFIPKIVRTSGRLYGEFVCLLF